MHATSKNSLATATKRQRFLIANRAGAEHLKKRTLKLGPQSCEQQIQPEAGSPQEVLMTSAQLDFFEREVPK